MKTRDENWAKLEQQRDEARLVLRGMSSIIIADQVLRAGWHPYEGEGRAIWEILVARHDAQHPSPLHPQIGPRDVLAVAGTLGYAPIFPAHLESPADHPPASGERSQKPVESPPTVTEAREVTLGGPDG